MAGSPHGQDRTFDGPQGTDLACLIRRLKHLLHTPVGGICCVGPSATL